MKHVLSAATVGALVVITVAACGASTATPATSVTPQAAAAPAFDTIDIDVSGGANPAVITYDTEHGSDSTSHTWQIVQATPFHLELAKPHGAHDVKVTAMTMAFKGAPAFSCILRVNGQIVASGEESEPGGGATCAYVGMTS